MLEVGAKSRLARNLASGWANKRKSEIDLCPYL